MSFPIYYFEFPESIRDGSSMSSVQGCRKRMEDQHLVASYDDLEMYGVFDGHGGSDVVKFVARHLAEALLPPFEAREKSGISMKELKTTVDTVYRNLDREMFERRFDAGCCALVTIFDKKSCDMWVINLGDSKALLFTKDCQQLLQTFEKTPADADEKERIVNAEAEVRGKVTQKTPNGVERINGKLAVSRAFGDIEFKTPAKNSSHYTPRRGPVSVIPIFHHIKLNFNSTYYLLMACDGLWFDGGITNQFTNEEVMNSIAHKHVDAKSLVEEAIDRGSKDNVTVMIVKFEIVM